MINIHKAIKKEHEILPDNYVNFASKIIDDTKTLEREFIDELIKTRFKKEIEMSGDIKGLGPNIVVQLLIECHPYNFSRSGFLAYLGLCENSMKSHKYNRSAKCIIFKLFTSVITKKNKKYTAYYNKLKENMMAKGDKRGVAHGKARNRTMTLIAKDIHKLYHKIPETKVMIQKQ